MKAIKLVLPFPPSNNTYYRHVGPKVLISEPGRIYRVRVAEQKLEHCIRDHEVKGRLKVRILVYPPDLRVRDLDNLPKACLDALQWARVIESDKLIDNLHIIRGAPDRPNGHLVVHIEEMASFIGLGEMGDVA